MNSSETGKRTTKRLRRMIIDPAIFVTGMIIPFVLLLSALDHSPFLIFRVLGLADAQNATIGVITTIVPMSIVAALTSMGAVVKVVMKGAENPETSFRDLNLNEDPRFYSNLFVCSVVLLISTVVLLAKFDGLVKQSAPMTDDQFWTVWFFMMVCLSVSFLLSIVLSARNDVMKELTEEIVNIK